MYSDFRSWPPLSKKRKWITITAESGLYLQRAIKEATIPSGAVHKERQHFFHYFQHQPLTCQQIFWPRCSSERSYNPLLSTWDLSPKLAVNLWKLFTKDNQRKLVKPLKLDQIGLWFNMVFLKIWLRFRFRYQSKNGVRQFLLVSVDDLPKHTLPMKMSLCPINWGTQWTMKISSNE